MQKVVLGRDVDFTSLDRDLLDVTVVNLLAVSRNEYGAATIEAANMTAGCRDKYAPNFRIAIGLCVCQRIMDALGGNREVNDFTFAYASRGRQSYAQNA
jgi:hypothetical protein